jgi:cell division protein FtsB
MKPNLLNTSTLKEQRKRLIWRIIVYSIAAFTLINIGSVQLLQLYTLWKAKKDYDQEAPAAKQFDHLTEQEKTLKQEITQLQEILDSVAAQQKAHQIFAFSLHLIINIIPSEALKRLEFNNQKIKITFLAPSLEAIQTYIQQLKKQTWCDTLHINSLEKDNDETPYTITLIIQLNQI